MKKFFSYSSETGLDFHSTAEEAKLAAQKIMDLCRECAVCDGEWPEEAETIIWGEVKGSARVTPGRPEYTDYKIVETATESAQLAA